MQNSFSSLYSNFILNLFIVYEFDNWSRNPTNNFPLKKLVRNAIKIKFTLIGRGIAFDGEGSWSFDDDSARNVVIFGVDDSSSSHTEN